MWAVMSKAFRLTKTRRGMRARDLRKVEETGQEWRVAAQMCGRNDPVEGDG